MSEEIRYTSEHEWLRQDADGLLTVGITHHAEHALGDIVYVQLPELRAYGQGDEVAVVESVKAASNILMPLPGVVVAVNGALDDSPEKINQDAQGEGWFFRLRPDDAAAWAGLLTQADYERLIESDTDS